MQQKKSFKTSNPALSFIESGLQNTGANMPMSTHTYHQDDTLQQAVVLLSDAEHVQTYTHTKRETKSRRLQLLIKPSIHAGISNIALRNDTSVNDAINTILEEYLRKEGI